jgi:hypothetical protein
VFVHIPVTPQPGFLHQAFFSLEVSGDSGRRRAQGRMASPEASAASSIAPSGTTFPEAVFEDLSSPLLGWKKKVCFLQTLAASMPVNNNASQYKTFCASKLHIFVSSYLAG